MPMVVFRSFITMLHIFLSKESHRGPDLGITIVVFVMFFKSRLVLSLDLDFRRVMILKLTTTASTGTTTTTTTIVCFIISWLKHISR